MRGYVAIAVLLVACGAAPDAPPPLPDAASVAIDQAVTDHVEGTIAGQPFTALDVRFRIRDGAAARVDLWLADAAIERCGLAQPRSGTRVWLRFADVTSLAPGSYVQNGAEDDVVEAHYERAVGRRFEEIHRARTEVEIVSASVTAITGRVRTCFADAAGSCVGGHFRATPCWSRVDGRTLREPPGLDDHALEPRGTP